MQRRSFLRTVTGAGLLAGGGGLLWSGAIAPSQIVTERLQLPAPHPGLRGLTLAQFSDIHWDPYCNPFLLQQLRQLLVNEPADILVFTGDLYTRKVQQEARLIELLAALPAKLGPQARFACVGNHDVWLERRKAERGRAVQQTLTSAGWSLLKNRLTQPNDLPLLIGGLDSHWGGQPDLRPLQQRRDLPLLLLAHEPDPFPNTAKALTTLHLMLSGHTHGGQVCLPTFGESVVLRLPIWGRLYPRGLFRAPTESGEARLYVNRGLGTGGVPLRLACPPELTRITWV